MDPIRFGIAGPGRIAASVAPDFAFVEGTELVAVGSRSLDRAQAFAQEHGIARAHGSYAELIADDGVDAIYIATPHPQHRAIALEAIAHGKAVVIEKAFTATLAGAQEVVDAARAAGVFAMEAMWTRFHPAVARMRQLIAEGAIGEVTGVQAELGIVHDYDPSDRLFAAELGGGALLDLGVYTVSLAQMVLGAPQSVTAHGAFEVNGVEHSAGLLLGYEDGRTAALQVAMHSPMPGAARVFGTDGWIELPPRFHHPSRLVWSGGAEEHPTIGAGYAAQFAEAAACIREGNGESAVMSLDDTLAVMAVLDEAARQLGVTRREAG